MSSEICLNLDQSEILLSGNGLRQTIGFFLTAFELKLVGNIMKSPVV